MKFSTRRIKYLDSTRSLVRKKPSPTRAGGMYRKAVTGTTVWIFIMMAVTLLVPIAAEDDLFLDDIGEAGAKSVIPNQLRTCRWEIKRIDLPEWQKECLSANGVTASYADNVDRFLKNEAYQTTRAVFSANPTGYPKLGAINVLKTALAKNCGGDKQNVLAQFVGNRPVQALTLTLQGIATFFEVVFNVLTLGQYIPKIGGFFGQLKKSFKLLRKRVKNLNKDNKRRCKEDAGPVQKYLIKFFELWGYISKAVQVFFDVLFPAIANPLCNSHNADFTALVGTGANCGSKVNYDKWRISGRRINENSCSLQGVLDTVQTSVDGLVDVTDGIQSFVDVANGVIGPFAPLIKEVVDKVADVLKTFDPVLDELKPFKSFFDSLYDALKFFECDFCDSIAGAVNDAVEVVVDAFLSPLGFSMEELTTKLLASFDINIPGIIDFSAFDTDFVTPLTSLLRDIEDGLASITGQVNWDKFDVTEKLNEALATCSGSRTWPIRVATAYGDNDLFLNCKSYANTRPVAYTAIYSRGTCSQDMTGFFRFPCEDESNKSSCTISNYNRNSRCPDDVASYELFPGFSSSTLFQVTYYCINQEETPDILAGLLVVNTDAIELALDTPANEGDTFPIVGSKSKKFTKGPKKETRPQEITCPAKSRIDLDARSSRRTNGFGDYYDSVGNPSDAKYIQDLSYWDFYYFKENTDGTSGIGRNLEFGGGPSDEFKEWWTTRDAHDFFLIESFTLSTSALCADPKVTRSVRFECSVCPEETATAGQCADHQFCPTIKTPSAWKTALKCVGGGSITGDTGCTATEVLSHGPSYEGVCPQNGNDYERRKAEVERRSRMYEAFYQYAIDDQSCIKKWNACIGAKDCRWDGCETDYHHYACADFSSDVSNAQVIYHYGGTVDTPTGKTITCPMTLVQQRLVILKAEIGVGFASADVTGKLLKNHCTLTDNRCTIDAKGFGNTLDYLDENLKTLRVEYFCTCPAGYDVLPVLDGDGDTCSPCGDGQYRKDSMAECVEVPAGFYSGAPEDRGDMYPCAIGTYTDSTGNTVCLQCPEGYWSDVEAATTCKECGDGSANPGLGRTTSCDICGPGTQPSGTRGECVDCPCGTFCPGDGFSYACDPGTHAVTAGKQSCVDAPAGGFQPEAGQCEYFIAGKGLYVVGTGAVRPFKCPEGFTTAGFGSTSVSDCIEISPVTCPAESLWKTSSGKEESCKALVDLLHLNITERGNGFCQKCLNVEECDWDGGDCCPETCEQVTFDFDDDGVPDEVLSASCNPRNMECLMPNRDLTNFDCTNTPGLVDETVVSDCNPEDPRVGNGFCDTDLNFKECGYDGGDCCLFSCLTSYGPFCAWDKMDCKDPEGLIDIENPRLKNLPLAQVPVCLISNVPSVPKVTAIDNDPCFTEEPAFRELSIASTPSNGQTSLNRTWSVADPQENMDEFVQTITYFEADIRLWDKQAIDDFIQLDCALPITIAVHPVLHGGNGQSNKPRKCLKIDDNAFVPVAIYGTEFLNVSLVDTDSLVLNGLRIKRCNNGCRVKDMNGDGIDDLICKFEDDSLEWGILADGDPLILSGALSDRTPFTGEDTEYCIEKTSVPRLLRG